MKQRVVMFKNLPSRPPVFQSITMWLLLDRTQASGVWWGVSATLFAVVWIGWIVAQFTEQPTDVFEGKGRL